MNEEIKFKDFRIRKVKVLPNHLKELAISNGCEENDLLIVETKMERVEGDPIQYLLNKIQRRAKESEVNGRQ